MKIKSFFAVAALAVLSIVSCKKTEEDYKLPAATVEPVSITLDATVDSKTFTITSNRDWTLSSNAEWLAFSPAEGTASSSAVTVTVTATANPDYNRTGTISFVAGGGIVTKTITVEQAGDKGGTSSGDGSLENPYTPTAANELANGMTSDETSDYVYVKGIISEITSVEPSYGNATYYISNDGSTTDQFLIYRGKYLGNTKFTSEDQIQVGYEVVVYGQIVNFKGNTPEMTTGNYIYSLNGKTSGGSDTGETADVKTVTVAEFLAAEESQTQPYQLTGTIGGSINTTYGNFDLTDDTGTVYVYGLTATNLGYGTKNDQSYASLGLKAGDKVTIIGYRGSYNDKDEVVYAYYVSHEAGEGGGDTPDQPTEGTIFSETFASSQGDFTIEDKTLPDGISYVWQFNSQYGMKASAYVSKTNYATESWLISPEIDLSSVSKAYLTFDHAARYFSNASTELTLWISKDGGDWTQLTIPNYPDGSSWNFVSSGEIDLASYVGSKIKLGWKYTSSSSSAPTWEIKNVLVSTNSSGSSTGGDDDDDDDDDPTTGGTTVSFNLNSTAQTWTSDSHDTYGSGYTSTTQGVTVAYYKYKSTTELKSPYDGHIRVYKSSALLVTAPTGKTMTKIVFTCAYADKCYDLTDASGSTIATADTSAKTVTWTGSANSFVGFATNGQLRISAIEITYSE